MSAIFRKLNIQFAENADLHVRNWRSTSQKASETEGFLYHKCSNMENLQSRNDELMFWAHSWGVISKFPVLVKIRMSWVSFVKHTRLPSCTNIILNLVLAMLFLLFITGFYSFRIFFGIKHFYQDFTHISDAFDIFFIVFFWINSLVFKLIVM